MIDDRRYDHVLSPDVNYAERLAIKYERVFGGHVHVHRRIGDERALLGLPRDVRRCRCGHIEVEAPDSLWG